MSIVSDEPGHEESGHEESGHEEPGHGDDDMDEGGEAPILSPEFDLVIERPRGWTDSTLYSFTSPKADSETGRAALVIVAIERILPLASFGSFVGQALASYSAELPDLQVTTRREGRIGKRAAHEIIFTWDAGDHRVRHRMVYLKTGPREMVRFNASAADGDFDRHADAFNAVLASVERRKR